jgi:hypothetical protein
MIYHKHFNDAFLPNKIWSYPTEDDFHEKIQFCNLMLSNVPHFNNLIMLYHRCLERQAFGTPRMYTLSPSKSIKGSNYGEFLKDKNVLLCTRLYKYAPNLESLLTDKIRKIWEHVVRWKWARTWISALLSATENYILKFLTVSSVSSDSLVREPPFNLKGGGGGFNIRLFDKNFESNFFFPPPKSEYFFQQHWESE